MTLNYQYRIYPSNKQKVRLFNHFKVCCDIYNSLRDVRRHEYQVNGLSVGKYGTDKILTDWKRSHPELSDVYAQVLQNVSDRLNKAFQNFFRRCEQKKKGRRIKVGYPRFKRRVKSLTYPQSGFSIEDTRLVLGKIGRIPIVIDREMKGEIKTLTVKHRASGKWFATFSVDTTEPVPVHPHKNRSIGIDMGLESFLTFTDGTKIENPRYFRKAEKKLAKYQRQHSRKVKGSKNREKARIKVAIAHEKVFNQRRDFSHKLSTYLTQTYGNISIENLNINGMLKNHCVAKSISDAGWRFFLDMTIYKAAKAGGRVIEGKSFSPTSKTCSRCGNIKKDLRLNDRVYECKECGLVMDRDRNAAINIQKEGHEIMVHNKGHTLGRRGIQARGDRASTSVKGRNASSLDEAGTKSGNDRP